MFGSNSLKRIGNGIFALSDGLSKLNQTIHGSAEAAAKATNITKRTGSAMMTIKGVKDCVVTYRCNDMICFTVSAVGTTADVGNWICGRTYPRFETIYRNNYSYLSRMQVFCPHMPNRRSDMVV